MTDELFPVPEPNPPVDERDHAVGPHLLDHLLDSTLRLKVHGSGGGSDEALRLDEDDRGASALDARLDGDAADAVAFADHDDALAFEVHGAILPPVTCP